MKCPWGCGWEGTPEEYAEHLRTCPEYAKPSERPGEYKLSDIADDISTITKKINLRFIPRSSYEELTRDSVLKALEVARQNALG